MIVPETTLPNLHIWKEVIVIALPIQAMEMDIFGATALDDFTLTLTFALCAMLTIIKLDRMQFIVSFHLSLLSRLLSKNDISIDKFSILYLSSKIQYFYDMNHLSNSSGVLSQPIVLGWMTVKKTPKIY